MQRTARLKISHYFGIEGVNAFNATLFLYCVFFWTKQRYGFSDAENLLLTSAHGLVYIFASKFGGRLADRMGYDRLISWCLLGMAVTLALAWIPTWRGMPFVAVAFYTLFIGPVWPALEAAILHSPGATSMPDRLGFYNVTWALTDALGFFASGFLFRWRPDSILWIPALLHLAQYAWLKFGPHHILGEGEGAAMDLPHSGDEVPRTVKRRFMHTSWLGNGLGYVMIAGFTALTPQMGARLGWAERPDLTIWLSCTLLFARAAAFVLFWKWERWHHRMGWLQGALWLGPAMLAAAFFINHVPTLFAALVVFGFAVGLVYSGSLYYSLDYGENKGEIGGVHEAILGVGIFVGPLLASGAAFAGWGAVGAQIVLLVLVVLSNLLGTWIIRRANPPA